MEGSLNKEAIAGSAAESAAASLDTPGALEAVNAQIAETRAGIGDTSLDLAKKVNISDIDLAAIQADSQARLIGGTPEEQAIARAREAGVLQDDGLDALGNPLVLSENRSTSAHRTAAELGLAQEAGELVLDPSTNTFVPANVLANNAAQGAGPVTGGALNIGSELSGFNPSQNITDLSATGLQDLEKSSRANTLRDLQDLLGAQFDDLAPLLAAEAERRGESELSAEGFAEILRGSLGSSAEASPEQLERINTIAEENIARSGSDLDASLQRGLEQLREEAGAGRGLRFTDTPIFNEAQQSVNEAQRLQAQSISTARGAQASAELNLPLALQQLEFQRAGLAQNAQSFEEQLAQQAFANRTLLLGNTQGFGLDLLSTTPSQLALQQGSDRLAFDKSEGRKDRQTAQDARKIGAITGIAGLFG